VEHRRPSKDADRARIVPRDCSGPRVRRGARMLRPACRSKAGGGGGGSERGSRSRRWRNLRGLLAERRSTLEHATSLSNDVSVTGPAIASARCGMISEGGDPPHHPTSTEWLCHLRRAQLSSHGSVASTGVAPAAPRPRCPCAVAPRAQIGRAQPRAVRFRRSRGRAIFAGQLRARPGGHSPVDTSFTWWAPRRSSSRTSGRAYVLRRATCATQRPKQPGGPKRRGATATFVGA